MSRTGAVFNSVEGSHNFIGTLLIIEMELADPPLKTWAAEYVEQPLPRFEVSPAKVV